jgi:hypothetical protein
MPGIVSIASPAVMRFTDREGQGLFGVSLPPQQFSVVI